MITPKKGDNARWLAEPVVVTSDPQMMVEITGPGGVSYVPVDELKPAVDRATEKARELVAAEHDRNGSPVAATDTRSGARDHFPDVHVLAGYIRANHLTVGRLWDALASARLFSHWSFSPCAIEQLHAALTGEKA